MSTKFVIFYLKWISNLCFTALQNLSEHKCADLIIMTPISPFVPSCPLKQTEQAWRGCEKGGFHFEKSKLLAGLQDRGFNSHRIPTYPLYWKALWIMFFEKWHKLHYFFAKSTAASGGARGVSWQSIHECSKFLSVTRNVALLASGAATLYWSGKSETRPEISITASCAL